MTVARSIDDVLKGCSLRPWWDTPVLVPVE